MSVFPNKVLEFLTFCEAHAEVWSNVGSTIGLSAAQIAAFEADTAAARAAFNAHTATTDADRAAAGAQRDAISALRTRGGDIVRSIRAFAEQQTTPNTVYQTAQIPPPAVPGTMPPPGLPFDFSAGLNPDGSITFRWKCDNPKGASGTVYNVRRKSEGESAFTYIGSVGERRYTDATIPAGANRVEYTVTGQRGPSIGPASSVFTVLFGQAGGGGIAISRQFTSESAPRAAAQSKLAA